MDSITFIFERETKGSLVFTEQPNQPDNPQIGTIYLRKAPLAGRRPKQLKVTVEEVS